MTRHTTTTLVFRKLTWYIFLSFGSSSYFYPCIFFRHKLATILECHSHLNYNEWWHSKFKSSIIKIEYLPLKLQLEVDHQTLVVEASHHLEH